MESLALLVCILFLIVLLSGPLAILFCYLDMFWMTVIFSIFAVGVGAQWLIATPFPISIVGAISIVLGIYSIIRI